MSHFAVCTACKAEVGAGQAHAEGCQFRQRTPLEEAAMYIWHAVRDQIAENVPSFTTLDGLEVAEICWAVMQHVNTCSECSWKHLDKIRDDYMKDGGL